MIPVSYDKAILAEINWNTRHMVDSMLVKEIPLEYVKASAENPYSCYVTRIGMDFSSLMRRRYYNYVMTVVHNVE
jgi:hypothetical protein